MRFLSIVVILLGFSIGAGAQQRPTPAPKQEAVPATPQTLEVEKVQSSEAPKAPAPPTASEAGYMEPVQVEEFLHKIWLAEFRINDLLTQVQPDQWKLADAARGSFLKTLETLRAELGALEDWRGQFEKRPDSMFLGYESYAAMGAVLPRLDGVARSISQHENASLGAQYSQAGNQLFDLQQGLRPYLSYLLRNQDQLLLASQNNLASCQNELGFAMRGKAGPAKPIGNTLTGRPARRHLRPTVGRAKSAKGEKKSEKMPESKAGAAKTPSAPAPANAQKKKP